MRSRPNILKPVPQNPPVSWDIDEAQSVRRGHPVAAKDLALVGIGISRQDDMLSA